MQSKPLSSLDYLIVPATPGPGAPASIAPVAAPSAPITVSPGSLLEPGNSPAARVQSSIDEAAVALGIPVLNALYRDPQGKQTTFQLVDALDVSVQDLSPVLEILAGRFQWIEIDRSDRKGNYQITLTPRGRSYIEKYGAK